MGAIPLQLQRPNLVRVTFTEGTVFSMLTTPPNSWRAKILGDRVRRVSYSGDQSIGGESFFYGSTTPISSARPYSDSFFWGGGGGDVLPYHLTISLQILHVWGDSRLGMFKGARPWFSGILHTPTPYVIERPNFAC